MTTRIVRFQGRYPFKYIKTIRFPSQSQNSNDWLLDNGHLSERDEQSCIMKVVVKHPLNPPAPPI